MATEIKVPTLGESVSEATVAQWLKKEGEAVTADEPLVELETDKVTLEVNAPAAGVLQKITVNSGENVGVDAVLGLLEEGAVANDKGSDKKPDEKDSGKEKEQPKAEDKPAKDEAPKETDSKPTTANADMPLSPAVRKLVDDNNLDPAQIPATGKDGRLLKNDVQDFIDNGGKKAAPAAAPAQDRGPREERVRMTRLRQSIAKRLKEAQNTAAMLTTFNEVDMTNVMELRKMYKDSFEKRHNTKLGFMSFFVKAAIQALQDFPAVNAEIDGEEIVYKNHYDIGVAVSTPSGLVVPVLKDADIKNFAEIESGIVDLGTRARDGKLGMDEMTGGTFTITNGGVFGSLLSTPILNPPQSGILGMHKIQERPMVVDGEVKVRPMMYLAMSYDHRIVDGREAVSFLVRIKDAIEDPQRLLLDI
ncbi:MAG: 2-oxoglutarate dehydrogenase complex dihydrolipoyllysine-residue succinyltransferase [Pseudomonadota bacterium]